MLRLSLFHQVGNVDFNCSDFISRKVIYQGEKSGSSDVYLTDPERTAYITAIEPVNFVSSFKCQIKAWSSLAMAKYRDKNSNFLEGSKFL